MTPDGKPQVVRFPPGTFYVDGNRITYASGRTFCYTTRGFISFVGHSTRPSIVKSPS